MKQEERLFHLIGSLPDDVVSQTDAPKKKRRWIPVAVAACLMVAVGAGIWYGGPGQEENWPALVQNFTTNDQREIVSTDGLERGPELNWPRVGGMQEASLRYSILPVNDRMAEYHQVEDPNGIPKEQRPQYLGEPYRDLEGWYLPGDNVGLRYLVHREEDGSYTLWEFSSFAVWDQETLGQVADSIENVENYIWAGVEWFSLDMNFSPYTYGEVLETIYGVTSADDLVCVTIHPATMDNTDAGKALQKEIGTRTITDRDGLTALYDAIAGMTCYGSNQWELIDLGDTGSGEGLLNSVRLCRYLTVETVHGIIDSLKYSAAGGQFYEYGGIAYAPLTQETAGRLNEIFEIE